MGLTYKLVLLVSSCPTTAMNQVKKYTLKEVEMWENTPPYPSTQSEGCSPGMGKQVVNGWG